MSEVFQSRWYALRLASIAIARNGTDLDRLLENLTLQSTDSEIAGVWRQARIVLREGDNRWLETELHRILVQNQEAVA